MSKVRIGRRDVIRRSLTVLGAAALVPSALAACGGSESDSLDCSDTSSLPPAQAQMRQTQSYVEASPHADKHCNNCSFYTAGQSANVCGSCSVIQGGINPQGYCNLWSARS